MLTSLKGVAYASVALPSDTGYPRLERAISDLLLSAEDAQPELLWTLRYQQRTNLSTQALRESGGLINLPALRDDLVLDDSVLDGVRQAWQSITSEEQSVFMKFEAREGGEEEE